MLITALAASLAHAYLVTGRNAPGAANGIKMDTSTAEYIQLAPTAVSGASLADGRPYSDRHDLDAEQFAIADDDDEDLRSPRRSREVHAAALAV